MTIIRSYSDASEACRQRGKPSLRKKIDNNTYVERLFLRDGSYVVGLENEHTISPELPDAFGIRLHATWVVIYTADGRCILNTGGWLTVTTKARINLFTPQNLSIYSHRGRWFVTHERKLHHYSRTLSDGRVLQDSWHGADTDTALPFADGITFQDIDGVWTPVAGTYPEPSVLERQEALNKKVEKAVKTFLKGADAFLIEQQRLLRENGSLNPSGDCLYCQGFVTDFHTNLPSDSNDHLWSHIQDGYHQLSLFINAYQHNRDGGSKPESIERFLRQLSIGFHDRAKKHLRSYLLDRLRDGSVQGQHGSRKSIGEPTTPTVDHVAASERAQVEAALAEALQKPEDYAYWGDDERLYVSSAPSFTSIVRGDDTANESNYRTVLKRLQERFPDLWREDQPGTGDLSPWIYVLPQNHWAVGPIDSIVVPVLIDHDGPRTYENTHEAFRLVTGWAFDVKTYPVLDEADYAALEKEWADA